MIIELRPIGVVRSWENDATAASAHRESLVVEVYPDYAEGLTGIERLSEVQVLYWMHKLDENDRNTLITHPRGEKARPKEGVFALRSPMRPNPVGSSVVRLLGREGNKLFVTGLDAMVGSPVLDIKHP
jgi:tRNA-Thr(GGU) m(6)t(6)A37 methyltransferase TsaA